MADQLAVWNVALAHLGERRLASLVEAREPARVLADEWLPAVCGCLELTSWSFATRTQPFLAAGVGPNQYPSAFLKPDDWLRTVDIAQDVAMTIPLDGYVEEGLYWYAAPTAIYVRYISTGPDFGLRVQSWSQQFADFVALALAARCCRRLTGSSEMLGDLVKLRENAAKDALAYEEQTAARTFPLGTVAGETKLQVFNDALAYLGRARIPSLVQASDTVRQLNDQYRSALRWCLQRAPWNFACVSVALTPVGIVNRQGYGNAFPKPPDWVLTANVALDIALQIPAEGYVEEGAYWFANAPQIGVRYVSITAGGDPTQWPTSFCDLLALRLAELCCGRLAADAKDVLPAIVKDRDAAVTQAVAIEAGTVGRVFPVVGTALTRLQTYNDALAHLGLPRVVGLTDNTETVRALNDQWRGAVLWSLQQAPWTFAANAQTLSPLAQGRGSLNFDHVYTIPDDWVMTLDLAQDGLGTVPLPDFAEESGFWCTNTTSLYVRYVSSNALHGFNLALWPASFRDLVALRLAEMCAGRLGAGAAAGPIAEKRNATCKDAVAIEAARTQHSFPPDAPGQTQLRAYNAALAYLGQPRLYALTQVSPTMRLLNDAWALAVRWALEQGPWTFAIRAVMIGPYGNQVPTFGFKNAFRKPDDWLQTVEVSEWEDFRAGSTAFEDETGWWFADAPGLFVRYVSLGPNYGMNLPRWSPSFGDLVAARMAELLAPNLAATAAQLATINAQRNEAMKRLRATDALNTPPRFPPEGAWVRARRGGWAAGRRFGDGPGGPPIPLTGDSTLGGDSDLPVNTDIVPRISG